jgi:hypothetical protein
MLLWLKMVLKLTILDVRMWTEGLVQFWTSTQVHYHEYQGTENNERLGGSSSSPSMAAEK